MDHDALFKTLLTTFFAEFAEGFLPDIAGEIDLTSIAFQPQEIFSDLSAGERHIVDLVVKVRLRGQEAFLLIHVENQSRTEADFAFRMFRYAALLHLKYRLPVYSVVIFSHDAPKRQEPNRYEVALFGKTLLRFDYKVIQLNQLSWRKFIQTPNPVAAALMTKMNIAPQDRVRVTREIVRMMATLKLDPARTDLIGGFMNAYLKLTADEMLHYRRRYEQQNTPEQESDMKVWTDYGRAVLQGKADLIVLMLQRRFGSDAPQVKEELLELSIDELDQFGAAVLDFNSPADVNEWLARHASAATV